MSGGEKPKMVEPDFSQEISGGVRSVFDRIGEFFHLFDLSFFVSGAATFAAVVYWFLHQETEITLTRLPSWVYVVGLVVACYICGLLSFAAGRVCTSLWRQRSFSELLKEALAGHALTPKVSFYLQDDKRLPRLYERLWVEVRQMQKHVTSFSLLRRYWVMAATYDGIAISCLAWVVVLLLEPPIARTSFANYLLPGLLLGGTIVSFKQGYSYFKYQIFEIVATVAASKSSLDL